jgi:hypothetical protein
VLGGLGGLIEDAVTRTVDGAIDAIDDAVHDAARRLLDATFPPIVLAQYCAVKTEKSMSMGNLTYTLGNRIWHANVGMVLAGAVEKKVTEGLDRISANSNYSLAIESIRL